jgi:sporulation protein YlmC with PRC-barrel domain
MLIGIKKILRLPVFAESGAELGKITDADFDIETQSVLKYHATAGAFSGKKFLIDRSQVVEITAEKMIVEDPAVPEQAEERAVQSAPQAAFGSATQSVANQE